MHEREPGIRMRRAIEALVAASLLTVLSLALVRPHAPLPAPAASHLASLR